MQDKVLKDRKKETTLAEDARLLVASAQHGMLSTLIPDGGYPYGSMVDLIPLPDGDLVMLLSSLAEHQHYLDADGRASILIAPHFMDKNALAEPRVTLVGHVLYVKNKDSYTETYIEQHPDAKQFVRFGDFHFYRLHVEKARYIAGFGEMGWIPGSAYHSAPLR